MTDTINPARQLEPSNMSAHKRRLAAALQNVLQRQSSTEEGTDVAQHLDVLERLTLNRLAKPEADLTNFNEVLQSINTATPTIIAAIAQSSYDDAIVKMNDGDERAIIAITEATLAATSDPSEKANVQFALALLLERNARFDDALEHARAAHEVQDNHQTASKVANLLRRNNQLAEAATYFQQALAKAREEYGEINAHTFTAANELLYTRFNLNQDPQAIIGALEKNYNGAQQTLGADHFVTIMSGFNLGKIHDLRRNGDAADAYLRNGFETMRRVLGDTAAATLDAQLYLGDFYLRTNRVSLAIDVYSDFLKHTRTIVGDHHPEIWRGLEKLRTAYQQRGQHDSALEVSRELRASIAQLYGENDVRAINVQTMIAEDYTNAGQFENALKEFNEAVARFEAIGLAGDIRYYTNLMNIGHVHVRAGDLNAAKAAFQDAMDKIEVSSGQDTEEYTLALEQRGLVEFSNDQFEDAKATFSELIALLRKNIGDDHQVTLRARQNLAQTYVKLDEFDKAEQDFTDLVEGYTRVTGEATPELAEIFNALGTVLATTNRDEEAKRAFEKSLTIYDALGAASSAPSKIVSGKLAALQSSEDHS